MVPAECLAVGGAAGELAVAVAEGTIGQCGLGHHNHNIFQFVLPVVFVVERGGVVEVADSAVRLAVVGVVVGPVVEGESVVEGAGRLAEWVPVEPRGAIEQCDLIRSSHLKKKQVSPFPEFFSEISKFVIFTISERISGIHTQKISIKNSQK